MLRCLQRSASHSRCPSVLARSTRPGVHLQPLGRKLGYEKQKRAFWNLPSVLVPPVIFVGLAIGLWTWKCFMMILFQNKIIYMPGLPPNARWETIEDYKSQCGGIEWREERTRSMDGTRISLCLASVDTGNVTVEDVTRVYILYFQGNASSLPPRLPSLSSVLRMLKKHHLQDRRRIQYTFVCCSYRGYWTSKGRPSEKGIALDATAAFEWIEADHGRQNRTSDQPVLVILWGQSIGAGVATSLAARMSLSPINLAIKTLILETPFSSIRAMLETLYPQKWLPYRYLHPFLRNRLDNWKALGDLAERTNSSTVGAPKILILEAGKDELVPKSHGDMLEKRCLEVGLTVERKSIHNALHNEVMVRSGGLSAVVGAIEDIAKEDSLRFRKT